ncbi:helix-turn-helix domain-containing protein [Glycomyces sp. MUSA5-2]|uniref:helix-turn-helix domain-containing protein n=1 Tax=Glycomyces sp. MUSA5-2 TaxID=2053002 RepID=UPI003009AC42
MTRRRRRLQQRRREIGLSQEQLADACGVNTSTVRRWESGETEPQPRQRRLLALTLDLSPTELTGLLDTDAAALDRAMVPFAGYDPTPMDSEPGPDAVRDALEWILDPTGPLHSLTAAPGRTRHVGTALIDHVADRIIRFRRADDTVAARRLLPEVVGEIDRVETVLSHHSYNDTTGRRLHGMLAELYQLVGWMAIDLGRIRRGEEFYATGAAAARTAGDSALVAQLLSCNAYQRTSRGQDALLLARAALHGGRDTLSPLGRILLTERIAWAAANTGNADLARAALHDVDDTYVLVGTEPEPDWVYWLDRNESDVMAARCHLRLGDPGRAAALLRPAIDRYPADHKRERALYLTWLAESYTQSGNRDAATEVISEIEDLDVDSARLQTRLALIR